MVESWIVVLGLVFGLFTVVTVLSDALSLDGLWSLLSRRRCISGVVLVVTLFEGKTLGGGLQNRRDLADLSGK